VTLHGRARAIRELASVRRARSGRPPSWWSRRRWGSPPGGCRSRVTTVGTHIRSIHGERQSVTAPRLCSAHGNCGCRPVGLIVRARTSRLRINYARL